MTKRIYFYSTKNDVLKITNYVESNVSIKYILANHQLFPEYGNFIPIYNNAEYIPNIGVASRKSCINCEKYIVVERSVEINMVTRSLGGELQTFYEPGNAPSSITFTHSGFWNEKILINGLIETWSDSREAQKLMRKFMSAIKKNNFQKVGLFWVGPEAFSFFEQGGRLTINVDADPSLDLSSSVLSH